MGVMCSQSESWYQGIGCVVDSGLHFQQLGSNELNIQHPHWPFFFFFRYLVALLRNTVWFLNFTMLLTVCYGCSSWHVPWGAIVHGDGTSCTKSPVAVKCGSLRWWFFSTAFDRLHNPTSNMWVDLMLWWARQAQQHRVLPPHLPSWHDAFKASVEKSSLLCVYDSNPFLGGVVRIATPQIVTQTLCSNAGKA